MAIKICLKCEIRILNLYSNFSFVNKGLQELKWGNLKFVKNLQKKRPNGFCET